MCVVFAKETTNLLSEPIIFFSLSAETSSASNLSLFGEGRNRDEGRNMFATTIEQAVAYKRLPAEEVVPTYGI